MTDQTPAALSTPAALDRISEVVTAAGTLARVWDLEVVHEAITAHLTYSEADALADLLAVVTGDESRGVETMASWAANDDEWTEHAVELAEWAAPRPVEWAAAVAIVGGPDVEAVQAVAREMRAAGQ